MRRFKSYIKSMEFYLSYGRIDWTPSITSRNGFFIFDRVSGYFSQTHCPIRRDRLSWPEIFVFQPESTGSVRASVLHNTSNLTVLASVSKYIIDIPTAPKEPRSSAEDSKTFAYENFYESLLQRKKNDKSYRYFRNINRIAKDFPAAHSTDERKRVKVWCSNDYVRHHFCSSRPDKTNETSLAWGGIPL